MTHIITAIGHVFTRNTGHQDSRGRKTPACFDVKRSWIWILVFEVQVEASGTDSGVDFGLVKLWRQEKKKLWVFTQTRVCLDWIALHCEPPDNWSFP